MLPYALALIGRILSPCYYVPQIITVSASQPTHMCYETSATLNYSLAYHLDRNSFERLFLSFAFPSCSNCHAMWTSAASARLKHGE